MNSILQQLFLIKEFKTSILITKINNINEIKKSDDNLNLLFNLQTLFGYLEYGKTKYFDTYNFCMSYKDFDGNTIDMSRQSDSYEFLNLFFDKIEASLKNSKQVNLIKNIFSGII
jgi:ubiquitin C-terminal hydrolase